MTSSERLARGTPASPTSGRCERAERHAADAPSHRRRTVRRGATVGRVAGALLGALAATVAAPLAAQTILARDIAPFEAVYSVGNNVLTAGRARLSLERDGDAWVYSLSTRPTGVFKLTGKGRINETSVIDLERDGERVALRPRSYAYRQDEERRRAVDAEFDWEGGSLSWTYRGESGSEPLDGPLLDRLSVTLAVLNALRNGFETLELDIFDNGRIKTMRFTNEGSETLETPIGEVETIRVRSETASGSSRSTLTWFAPSLDYVPVRIEQRKRGDLVARLTLKRLKNRVTDLEIVDSAAEDGADADGAEESAAVGTEGGAEEDETDAPAAGGAMPDDGTDANRAIDEGAAERSRPTDAEAADGALDESS